MKSYSAKAQQSQGFALVVTLSLMILLTIIAVGLLSLSAVSLRTSSQGNARATAEANARLALMMAIGELQKEMGPDSRISAEAALFDSNADTEEIDGLAQSRWMASYNAWGGWLNAEYTPPGGRSMQISDTYQARRQSMFRRWLLSMPPNQETAINAPDTVAWNNTNSVALVGEGSLGRSATANPDQLTRAWLTPIGRTGKYAWWIGPENHRARVDKAKKPRNMGLDAWQTAQSDTAEVGVSGLAGLKSLASDPKTSDKLITTQTIRAAEVAKDDAQKHFFDLTANSQGVLASVRTGHLKKDLSLLFEQSANQLPAPYRFSPGQDIREPSIRPMSRELIAKNPAIPNRQFASWTNMRHYYRMYRSGSDATPTETGKTGAIVWNRSRPTTDFAVPATATSPNSDGSNHYWRAPILAKVTLIYSLVAKEVTKDKYNCFQYYSPVFTFWNPYNVDLVLPSGLLSIACKPYQLLPTNQRFYLNGVLRAQNGYTEAANFNATLGARSGGGDLVFKPGELRVFSLRTSGTSGTLNTTAELLPGYDPFAVAGDERTWTSANNTTLYSPGEKPGADYEFSSAQCGGGVNYGNTGGALIVNAKWPTSGSSIFPMTYSNDWFQRAPHPNDQTFTPITTPGPANIHLWQFDGNPRVVAYAQMTIKGLFQYDYPSISWERDWRTRNWIHAPPFYFGSGLYMSMDNTIAHTQRLDCPYVLTFGETSPFGVSKVVGQIGERAFLGPSEQVTSAAMLELPSAPLGSLASFANMRINPGWVAPAQYLKRGLSASDTYQLKTGRFSGNGSNSERASLWAAETKRVAYQSGVTGPGIGNSFMHPMLPRGDVYRFIDNSKSQDTLDRSNPKLTETVDTMAYCDYWDHVFLLNDTLWDDYFVSSLATQTRPGASSASSLNANIDRLLADQGIANSRYRYHKSGTLPADIKADLQASDGYLKAAGHLIVDGMFNVNSTSVAAWYSLFAGIRERKAVFRDSTGSLREIQVPNNHVAITRFDTEVTDKEMDSPETGAPMPHGSSGWSGVRFLNDEHLMKLAEECVKQVKRRGPFLNFSEFINRRLSNNDLGLMGALQSAIDYDDRSPDSRSINYRYKQASGHMLKRSELGETSFSTPEAAEGSRLAGIPGYVIQSDLLKPIANTLSVRDDTFRIRAYGEALDTNGTVVLARAWCEAVVQRVPEYLDSSANSADIPARLLDAEGNFSDNTALSIPNARFGRRFRIESFRWLSSSEI